MTPSSAAGAPGSAPAAFIVILYARTLLEGTLRQDQWPALAVADGHRANSLGRTTMGAAVPHHPGTLGAMEPSPRQAAQDPDRLGTAGDPANQALVAEPHADLRRRQRFRRARSARRGAPARLHDHPLAARCQPVSTRPPAAPRPTA